MAQYQLAGTAAVASVTNTPQLVAGKPDEFRHILKCTIPASNVSAPLVDFPVAVHFDSAAGANSLDLTEVFEQIRDTTLSYCNDDFSDENVWEQFGSSWSIDRNKWHYTGVANSSRLSYDGGRLKMNFAANYVRMQSYFGLVGDFDIQWDFDCTGSAHTLSWYFGLIMVATSGNNISLWRTYNGADRYRSTIGGSTNDDATSDHTGKLRITRVGSQITTYYWNGTGWTQLRQVTDHANDIKHVILDAQTWSLMPNPTVYIDNFQINSGTPTWDHYGPEKDVFYAFDEDNRPLPIDVDTIDYTNQKIILHVKVPYISATVDTNVYIAWDDATGERNSLAGWTGSVAARQAWDDDFAYVGHMNHLTPYSGLVLRRDQAIIENELPAATSDMDEADSKVSASHGRYCHFDTERYYFAEQSWMEPQSSDITLESYVFADVAANWAGIFSKDMNSSGRQWALIFNDSGYPRTTINGVFALATAAISPATWYYIAGRFDTSNFIQTRQDKAEVALNDSTAPSGMGTGTTNMYIGTFYSDTSTYKLDGGIGELRLSKVLRSEAWCNLTSDVLHDSVLQLELKKNLGGAAAVQSVTSTPVLQGPWDLGGEAAVVSLTSTPGLKLGGAGALPVIVVVT